MTAINEFKALRLAEITNQAVANISSSAMLPHVLDRLLDRLSRICNVKKGYVVEFKRGEEEFRLIDFLIKKRWSSTSRNLFWEFLGKGEWRHVDQGRLYTKILRRSRPYDPHIIFDWLDAKYGVHEKLRVEEAEVISAIAFPFVGEYGKLYLAMIMFDTSISRKWEAILTLSMGRIAYALFSFENAALPKHSSPRMLANHFSDLLTPRVLGWDTIDHSQRVRNICDILVESLMFPKKDRFMMSLVACCHDVGKRQLQNHDIRNIIELMKRRIEKKTSKKLTREQKADDLIYRQHPLFSALDFYEKYKSVPGEELRPWILPILCHHVGNDIVGRQIYKRKDLGKIKVALGVEGNTAGQILEHFKLNIKNIKNKTRILQAVDCLRIADAIEDHAGWKQYRPVQEAEITTAIERTKQNAKSRGFNPSVLKALYEYEERIIDFYNGLGSI